MGIWKGGKIINSCMLKCRGGYLHLELEIHLFTFTEARSPTKTHSLDDIMSNF